MDTISEIAKKHNLFVIEDACLLPGELIITRNGLKQIENMEAGDIVYTHKGNWRHVTKKMSRNYHEDIHEFYTYGVYEKLKITKDHPVLSIRTKNIREDRPKKWRRAEEIRVGDYIAFPRYKIVRDKRFFQLDKFSYKSANSKWKKVYEKRYKDKIEINKELMTIIGWYLAEGYCYRQHIEFSFSYKELENISKIIEAINYFKLDYSVRRSTGSTIKVNIFNKQLMHFLCDNFGTGASHKRIPEWVINLPSEKLKILLFSYIAGDGNKVRDRLSQFSVTSVSLDLLIGIKLICSKLGYYAGITKSSNEGLSIILGRQVNTKNKYQLRFSNYQHNKLDRRIFMDENYIYYRVKAINIKNYHGKVYNIEVKEDNSYCGLTWALHNCEAHGAKYKGKFVGNLGDMAAFSFYAAHLICCGEGGMVSTNNEKLAEILQSIRSHGRKPGTLYFDHVRFGINSKMNDMEASLGLQGVEEFWTTFDKRKENLYYLLNKLKDLEKFAFFNLEEEHEVVSPHAFTITLKDQKYNCSELYSYLESNGVMCKRNFGSIPTQHKAFAFMGHKFGEFPESEYVGNNGLHFGIHQYLTKEDLDYILDLVHKYFAKFS